MTISKFVVSVGVNVALMVVEPADWILTVVPERVITPVLLET